VLIAHREHRLLERAALDFGEEGGDFLMSGQLGSNRDDAGRL
jgi:hypothetical protein